MDRDRWLAATRGLLEPLLALAGASLVTLTLTVPFVPTTVELEFPLRWAGSGRSPLAAAELAERVQDLALAERVEVVERGEEQRLVLLGATDEDGSVPSQVFDLLEQIGYERDAFETRHEINMTRLMSKDLHVLPVMMTIQSTIFLLAGSLLSLWRVRWRWPLPPPAPLRTLLVGVVGGVAALLLGAVVSAGLEWLGLPVEEQAWLQELFTEPRMLALLAPWIVIIGPLAEEVFFRGYAFRFISEHVGLPAGALVSSVMFAVIHFNLSGFVFYLIIGSAMAYLYERTRSLVAPIVGHMTLNSLVLALQVGSGPG